MLFNMAYACYADNMGNINRVSAGHGKQLSQVMQDDAGSQGSNLPSLRLHSTITDAGIMAILHFDICGH